VNLQRIVRIVIYLTAFRPCEIGRRASILKTIYMVAESVLIGVCVADIPLIKYSNVADDNQHFQTLTVVYVLSMTQAFYFARPFVGFVK
jgi:ABC-type methionine transport system permease subunit